MDRGKRGRVRAGGRLRLRLAARALAALVLSAAPVSAQTAPGGNLLVFAAASLKNALDEVDAGYQQKRGGKAVASYAASGTLAKQMEAGAPADIFISADLKWMDYLSGRKLVRPETRANFLGNRLVLIAPADSARPVDIRPGFDLAGALGADGRLAMGQPQSVPAGKYAEQALTALGVWQSVKGRAAFADNVRAALALVSRGEAPLGIVYRTDAAADPKVTVVGTFPENSHPPITYSIAVTAGSKNPGLAKEYISYLMSPAARAAFEKQGFTVVE